jgi:hypothetical protein
MRAVPLLLLVLAVAWADTPPAEHRMKEGHAPTPFSAEQIRKGCPPGRVITLKIERPGKDPVQQKLHFVGGDKEFAEIEFVPMDKDGKHLREPVMRRSKWTALQAHASMPEKGLVITEGEVKVPVGKFKCWVYTQTTEAGGRKTVRTLHFAKKLPGPPVLVTVDVNGKRTQTVTMVARIAGKKPT